MGVLKRDYQKLRCELGLGQGHWEWRWTSEVKKRRHLSGQWLLHGIGPLMEQCAPWSTGSLPPSSLLLCSHRHLLWQEWPPSAPCWKNPGVSSVPFQWTFPSLTPGFGACVNYCSPSCEGSNLRKKVFVWAHNLRVWFIMVGEVWWQALVILSP